ncbi:hypothetical protein V1519DRAFT_436805 [Lipomyces tetrasporus]
MTIMTIIESACCLSRQQVWLLLTVASLKAFVHELLSQCRNLVTDLTFGVELPRQLGKDMADDYGNSTTGYSFVTEKRNRLNTRLLAIVRAVHGPELESTLGMSSYDVAPLPHPQVLQCRTFDCGIENKQSETQDLQWAQGYNLRDFTYHPSIEYFAR